MRFLADENFHGDVLRGIRAALPELDLIRVQDTSFSGVTDEQLLEEAARQGAVLLTHDVKTIPKYAYARIRAGLAMPGVIEIPQDAPIGEAIAELVIYLGAGIPDDFVNQVKYLLTG